MATKSMCYDHPDYTISRVAHFTIAAGANAVSANKFIAYTNVLIKSATAIVNTAGTSAAGGNAVIIKSITGNGTSTTALATITLGSSTAATATNIVIASGTATLTQGEQLSFTNGTDATGAAGVAIEYVLVPGANTTV